MDINNIEQEKAIEILTKKVDSWKCKRPRNPIIFNGLIDEIDTENNAIETVLSMLKEKDKEIEHWKNGFERELEDNRKNTYELLKQDLIIREKDKQIEHLKENINYQILCDFLISSTSDEEKPVWTEQHIEELLDNFEVRWKDAHKQSS